MKLLKSMTLAALVLAGAGNAYSTPTVVRIVGSNGDRTATQTAISHILTSGWTFYGTGGAATSANLSVATGANFGAWHGYYAGNELIIKVSFSGALAGISAVAGNTDQRFVVSSGTETSGSAPNPLTGTNLGVDYEIGKADFGFSTNFQSTSPFNGVYQNVTYDAVIEEVVGVSPLGFYASPGFPSTGANITTQLAQLLYTSGTVSLQLFTGDSADLNKTVWAIGRNTDAGQRYGAYTEIGLGTSSAVKVWQPTITGQTTTSGITYGGTVNSHILWPAETVSDIFSDVGGGGFSSGALVAVPLTATLGSDAYKGAYLDPDTNTQQYLFPNATAGYYIGYLTPSDGNPRILGTTGVVPVANRGVLLKYNGVDLTNANVQNGKYTAWLYNRILKSSTFNTTPGLKLTFANALRDQIKNVDAPSGGGLFNDSSFTVQRFTDGGLVVPK